MGRQLDDWLDTYVRYTDNSEPCSLYRTWCGVSAIASVLQRKAWFEWHTTIYPNFFTVLVGPAGCRKSTAIDQAVDLLEEIPINIAPQSTTREGLISLMAGSFMDTTVIDEETGSLENHSSATVHASELGVFIKAKDPQFLLDLTDLYDCRKHWSYHTKSRGTEEIKGVWLNLLGGVTPAVLQEILPMTAGVQGGLASRMIFVFAHRKGRTVPYPLKQVQDREAREKLIDDLEHMRLSIYGGYSVDEGWLAAWGPWYEAVDVNPPFEDPLLHAYCDRRATHLLKLCMVMAASGSSDKLLTEAVFNRSLKLLQDTEKTMAHVFRGYGRSEFAAVSADVEDLIRQRGTIVYGRLLARFMADVTKRELDEIVATLAAAGLIKQRFDGNQHLVIWAKKEKS